MSSTALPKPVANAAFGEEPIVEGSKIEEKVQGEGGGLSFLQHVACNICHAYLAEEPTRQFWMTSCGHIICNDPEHNNKAKICTVCNKAMESFLIAQGLQPHLEQWFQDSKTACRPIIAQGRKMEKEVAAAFKGYEGLISVLMFQLGHLSRETEHLRSTCKELKKENASLAAANDELHMKLAESKMALKTSSNPGQPVTPGHVPNNTQVTGAPPTLSQAPPTSRYDSGHYQSGPSGGDAYHSSLAKRQRLDVEESWHQGIHPTTPIHHDIAHFVTPRPIGRPLPAHPYELDPRSHSAHPFGPNRTMPSTSATPNQKLAKYRYQPNDQAPSTPERPLEPRYHQGPYTSNRPITQPRSDAMSMPPPADYPARPSWIDRPPPVDSRGGEASCTQGLDTHQAPMYSQNLQDVSDHSQAEQAYPQPRRFDHSLPMPQTPQQFRPAARLQIQYNPDSNQDLQRPPIRRPQAQIARQDKF